MISGIDRHGGHDYYSNYPGIPSAPPPEEAEEVPKKTFMECYVLTVSNMTKHRVVKVFESEKAAKAYIKSLNRKPDKPIKITKTIFIPEK